MKRVTKLFMGKAGNSITKTRPFCEDVTGFLLEYSESLERNEYKLRSKVNPFVHSTISQRMFKIIEKDLLPIFVIVEVIDFLKDTRDNYSVEVKEMINLVLVGVGQNSYFGKGKEISLSEYKVFDNSGQIVEYKDFYYQTFLAFHSWIKAGKGDDFVKLLEALNKVEIYSRIQEEYSRSGSILIPNWGELYYNKEYELYSTLPAEVLMSLTFEKH